MGQPVLKHGYYKIHFYLKCVVFIISINYFHEQETSINAEKEERKAVYTESFQDIMVV